MSSRASHLRCAARRAADFRQRTADETRVKFINQTEAVAFVRAERQQRDGLARIGCQIAFGCPRRHRAEAFCLPVSSPARGPSRWSRSPSQSRWENRSRPASETPTNAGSCPSSAFYRRTARLRTWPRCNLCRRGSP